MKNMGDHPMPSAHAPKQLYCNVQDTGLQYWEIVGVLMNSSFEYMDHALYDDLMS